MRQEGERDTLQKRVDDLNRYHERFKNEIETAKAKVRLWARS